MGVLAVHARQKALPTEISTSCEMILCVSDVCLALLSSSRHCDYKRNTSQDTFRSQTESASRHTKFFDILLLGDYVENSEPLRLTLHYEFTQP